MGMQSLLDTPILPNDVKLPMALALLILGSDLFICRQNLKVQTYVKILMGYVAFGWIVVEVFFYGIWCRPFLNYFVVKEGNSRASFLDARDDEVG